MPAKRRQKLLDERTWQRDLRLLETARELTETLGDEVFPDHNEFRRQVNEALDSTGIKLAESEKKVLLRAVSWRDEAAPPVILRRVRAQAPPDLDREALYGNYYEAGGLEEPAKIQLKGKKQEWLTLYEPDPELRDSEQVPLAERGGIEAFFRREVLPFASDAWIKADATRIGYEISFARHFYRPKPLRSLAQIRKDILKVEEQTEGLLKKIVGAEA